MSLPSEDRLIEAVISIVEPRARMGELHPLSPEIVRQEIERKLGLDESSLLEHEAFLKEVTQNTIEDTTAYSAGEEEGSEADVLDELQRKLEENGGDEQPSYSPIISSKRKRVESSSKPEKGPARKKPTQAKPKIVLMSDQDELSDVACDEDSEESYRAESKAEAKKSGKTRQPNSSKVKVVTASRKLGPPAANGVEDSDSDSTSDPPAKSKSKGKAKASAGKNSDVEYETPDHHPSSDIEQGEHGVSKPRSHGKPELAKKQSPVKSPNKAPDTPKSGTLKLLSGAQRLAIQGSEFKAAGNNIYTSYHFNLVNLTGLLQDLGISGLFQPMFDFFRSPDNRGASGEAQYPIHDCEAIRGTLRGSPTGHDVAEDRSSGTQPLENDCTLVDMSKLDLREVKTQEALTNAEIYTRLMMCSNAGLPCWYPEPRPPAGETGIVPGDVGTFDLMDGFTKIFNLWEDGFATRYPLPPKESIIHRNKFSQGYTIVKGISNSRPRSSEVRSRDISYNFECRDKQGAVLVCTTPADLEKLVDAIALERFLRKHARAVYQHANGIRGIGDQEYLFVVTGSIKSDSWGLAAYEDSRENSGEVLELSRMDGDENGPIRLQKYEWIYRGMAEARFGSNSEKVGGTYRGKDQTLFLRGHTLAFSQEFRNRENALAQVNLEHDLENFGSSDKRTNAGRSRHDTPQAGSGGSTNPLGTIGSTGGAADSLPGGVQLASFPPHSRTIFHPSERIAQFLLELTGADCALCHDDSWRHSPNFCTPSWGDVACLDVVVSKTIGVLDDVAYLIPGDEKAAASGSQQQEMVGPPRTIGGRPSSPLDIIMVDNVVVPNDLPPSYRTSDRDLHDYNRDPSEVFRSRDYDMYGRERKGRKRHWERKPKGIWRNRQRKKRLETIRIGIGSEQENENKRKRGRERGSSVKSVR